MIRSVLVTRASADCTDLAGIVGAHGVTVHPFPVLRVEDVVDDDGWVAVTNPDSAPGWLVLASPRAPERLVRQARRRCAEHLLELPVAVIGAGTAAAAAAAGLEPSLVGPGTGTELAAALNDRLDDSATVVYACGVHRRPELPEALTAAGHTVLPLVVYRMRATPPAELPPIDSDIDAVVVTSPRAARLYLEALGGRPLACPHWALGPTTRDAARTIGIDCRIPAEPTIESIAEALCRI